MKRNRKFKIGDVIKLASGGPIVEMTVARYYCDDPMIGDDQQFEGLLVCHWFVGNILHQGDFHEDELILQINA